MHSWLWFVAGALAIVAAALTLSYLRRGQKRSDWSPTRIGLGVAATLGSLALGGLLTEVQDLDPPEQRGFAVVVDGTDSDSRRGLDVGISLAAAVHVSECGAPVTVKLTVEPTAEFWIDNHKTLKRTAHVRVAIPDRDVHVVGVGTSDDALAPLISPFSSSTDLDSEEPRVSGLRPLTYASVPRSTLTVVTVDVPRWGRSLRPLEIDFEANWTEGRSRLGSCYVRLPALTGFPTALTGAELLGHATPLGDAPGGARSFFVVSSTEARLHAYYESKLEITRGVTSLELDGQTLQEGLSRPAPDASFGGAPAWTCQTTIPGAPGFVGTTKPFDEAQDFVGGNTSDASVAFSAARMAEILDQETCASFVVIEASSADSKRNLAFLAIGALFSFGIEFALSGVRRRRSGTGSAAAEASRIPRHVPLSLRSVRRR